MHAFLSILFSFAPLCFTALLPVVNPVGSALVFLGLVGELPSSRYKHLARRIALNTVGLLFIVDLLGALILNFFGISLPVVQLAGGGVLAAMGWELLNQKDTAKPIDAAVETSAPGSLDNQIFYPLTFPVTAGPGCIVVVLTLSAHASQHAVLKDVAAHSGILIGNVLVCALVYLSYAYAPSLTRRISPQTLHGVLRIIAFVLLCIGVQIAWKGVLGLIPTLATH